MRALGAQDILRLWEQGADRNLPDRALLLLATACPESTRDTLSSLSIGQRDTRLFAFRELTFGPALHAFIECPSCAERLEFALDTGALGRGESEPAASQEYELVCEGFDLRLRPPNSNDLAAALSCDGELAARRLLAERCVVRASFEHADIPGSDLPDGVVARLADRILECEPAAEILLDLSCPACRHSWQTPLDVVSFFWTEIIAKAKRLFHEVDMLARAYHWREEDILAMNPRRRQSYVDMVS